MAPFQGIFGVKLIQGILSLFTHFFIIPFLRNQCLVRCHKLPFIEYLWLQFLFSPFRFSYIAILCLSLLHQLDKINVEKAVNFIVSCKNMDGGFGCIPGGESHSGQSMLAISSFMFQVL